MCDHVWDAGIFVELGNAKIILPFVFVFADENFCWPEANVPEFCQGWLLSYFGKVCLLLGVGLYVETWASLWLIAARKAYL